MDFSLPNMDGMDPDDLEALVDVFTKAARYGDYKAQAMRLRAAGNICRAIIKEELCDKIYKSLPESARW